MDEWVHTPGAYISYPLYDYAPTERREDIAFQSQIPYKRGAAASARRREHHNMVGWNSSLKAPYQPLGTPRFDLATRPQPPDESARIQIRHPSRTKTSRLVNTDIHRPLETGRETLGRVAQHAYQYYMIYVPSQRILTITLVSLAGDPDMYVCNSNQYPSALDATWRSSQMGEDKITISPDDPSARPGTYYIGVYGGKDSRFTIGASLRVQPRKIAPLTDETPNAFGLIREELERARMRRLAAKRGEWLAWVEHEAPELRSANGAYYSPTVLATNQPAASASGGDAPQRSPEKSRTRAIVIAVPTAADLSIATDRAPIGQVERVLERSRSAALHPELRPSTTGAPNRLRTSRSGELRRIVPARFYVRTPHLASGAQPTTSLTDDAAATDGEADGPTIARARSPGAAVAALSPASKGRARALSEDITHEHRLAGHRSEYARVKRESNSKLVASLAQMGGERAYNHRLRTCALAHIDPTSSGLQFETMMGMMRTDAYSIKVELNRLDVERAKALNENPMWGKMYQGVSPNKKSHSGHYTRFKVNAISRLSAAGRAVPLMAPRRRSTESLDSNSLQASVDEAQS